jgi:carbon monoxide dehydrogenase subunit G
MTVQLPASPSEWFGYLPNGQPVAPKRNGARLFPVREVPIGHIDASRYLVASPEAVWHVLADPGTWDTWFAVHDSWIGEPESPLRAGGRMPARLGMLGISSALDWVVEAIEDAARIELVGTGAKGLTVRLMFRIAPAGTGSWMTVSAQFNGGLLSAAILDAVEADGLRQLGISLAELDTVARLAVQPAPAAPQLRLVHSATGGARLRNDPDRLRRRAAEVDGVGTHGGRGTRGTLRAVVGLDADRDHAGEVPPGQHA